MVDTRHRTRLDSAAREETIMAAAIPGCTAGAPFGAMLAEAPAD
jgi:hypothetical protein